MYDINRQSNPSLCEFNNNEICYYLSKSSKIQFIQKKPHHYQNQTHITQLIQHICRQLFYYSSSLQKVSSKQDQVMVQNILLENIKRITIHNCDKHGLIPQQKLFYLVVSCLHSRNCGVSSMREYLNEVHYFLTANVWSNPNQEVSFSLVMLLNGQYQELLSYAKQQLIFKSQPKYIQYLIEILVYKLQEQDNNHKKYLPNTSIGVLIQQINQSQWIQKLQLDLKKSNDGIFSIFQSKQQIEVILAILAGNQTVIEEICKGSWGLYLNLHVNFIQKLQQKNSTSKSYETIVRSYLQKYFANKKAKKSTQQAEEFFLIKLLNTFADSSRFSFHEIYQSSFNILTPILTHIIGLLLLQSRVVDLFSIINNKEYYQEILLNLVQNCNALSWSAFVHAIGFVQNATYFKDFNGKETMWETFLLQHLPYELQTNNQKNPLQNQVKEIQQKLQDLNIVGLSSFTKSYLNTLFHLQLKQSNSNGKLNQSILEIFFLTLEMSDSSTANSCFHQMKTFMTHYYRNFYFNYQLLHYLEKIFQRKQSILSEKMENKIEKLFCLPYKIKRIYQVTNIQTEEEKQDQLNLLQQIKQFNSMFISNKNKKTISLCVSLLQLASYLHQKIQNTLSLTTQTEMDEQQGISSNTKQYQRNLVKQFQRNLSDYLQQWKIYDRNNLQTQGLSENAFKELNYFDQYFY